MCSSCSMPFSTSATRVSRGVTLIRISSDTLPPSASGQAPEQRPGPVHRQAHHAGVAAFDAGYECAGAALDAVGAGLAAPLAARDVAGDVAFVHRAEIDDRFRHQVFLAAGVEHPYR